MMGDGKILCRCAPAGTMKVTRDAALNDSDKTFTVPARKMWRLITVHAELMCTATVGTRSLMGLIGDGTNTISTIARTAATANQKAVLKAMLGASLSTTVGYTPLLDGTLPDASTLVSLQPLYLPAGYTIRIFDVNAIDAAADDLTVILIYEEFDV